MTTVKNHQEVAALKFYNDNSQYRERNIKDRSISMKWKWFRTTG